MRSLISALAILLASILCNTSCGKKGGTSDPSPAASISSVSQDSTTTSSTFHFVVTLDKSSTKAITIHYSTVAGTAVANTDYVPATGTVNIPANQAQAGIDVTVTGDSLRKDNQTFFVQLDNPQNCTLQNDKGTGTIVNANGLYF